MYNIILKKEDYWNKAGFVAAFDTSGIVIDNEPPIVSICFF
jgi:hypothetical protein